MKRLSLYDMEMSIEDMIKMLTEKKEQGFNRIEVNNDWEGALGSFNEVTFFEFVK